MLHRPLALVSTLALCACPPPAAPLPTAAGAGEGEVVAAGEGEGEVVIAAGEGEGEAVVVGGEGEGEGVVGGEGEGEADAGVDGIPYVFVIAMENKAEAGIYGNANAPYINDVLMTEGAYASAYSDCFASAVPSEPHYVWLEAGTNSFDDHVFLTNAQPSASNATTDPDHLVAQLARQDAGRSWRSYQQGLNADTGLCPTKNARLLRSQTRSVHLLHRRRWAAAVRDQRDLCCPPPPLRRRRLRRRSRRERRRGLHLHHPRPLPRHARRERLHQRLHIDDGGGLHQRG